MTEKNALLAENKFFANNSPPTHSSALFAYDITLWSLILFVQTESNDINWIEAFCVIGQFWNSIQKALLRKQSLYLAGCDCAAREIVYEP